MRGHPSITRRLVASLTIVQIATLFLTLSATVIFNVVTAIRSGGSTIDEYSEYHARALLSDSLMRAVDGSLRIEPTPALLDYARERPSFQYAALDPSSRRPVPGSSPELVAGLAETGRVEIESTRFHIVGDTGAHRRGSMKRQETPAGEAILIVYGYAFGVSDFVFQIGNMLRGVFSAPVALFVSPLIAASAAITLTVVRHGLKPLGQAVASARRIDLDSLDQRLETEFVPTEIMPLVGAVNAALERVDAGVARQRRFMANAAHELRTPVAVLNARIDAPRKPDFDVDIKRDVRRIRNIVEQLLVTSRLGERPEEMDQEVDLVEVAQGQVADYTLLAIKAGRQIDFEAPSEPVCIKGNRRAIETIVANLVDNALRIEPVGGTVRVIVGTNASIAVVDHGAGVEASDREMIFEVFWRKNDATPGTGLGLAIVRELVDLHRGAISVKETPGGGATFEVALPKGDSC